MVMLLLLDKELFMNHWKCKIWLIIRLEESFILLLTIKSGSQQILGNQEVHSTVHKSQKSLELQFFTSTQMSLTFLMDACKLLFNIDKSSKKIFSLTSLDIEDLDTMNKINHSLPNQLCMIKLKLIHQYLNFILKNVSRKEL